MLTYERVIVRLERGLLFAAVLALLLGACAPASAAQAAAENCVSHLKSSHTSITRGAMTGVLVSVPFSVFAVISVLALPPLKTLGERATRQTAEGAALTWIMLGLGVAGLSGLGVILSYFWVEGRFLIDFSPALMLLSVLAFFQGKIPKARVDEEGRLSPGTVQTVKIREPFAAPSRTLWASRLAVLAAPPKFELGLPRNHENGHEPERIEQDPV